MYERFTDRARKVMQLANQEAQRLNHEYIGTEHILLGLVKEGSGVAANVLKNLDSGESGGGERTANKGKSKTPALDSFGRDLTELARQGKLDPVIGRQNEIERVIQVLSRRTKNNPVLLGEAGVGKTAIVEGLA